MPDPQTPIPVASIPPDLSADEENVKTTGQDTSSSADLMQQIFGLILARTGHDFSLYKQSAIKRRIERQMAVHQLDTLREYVHFIQQTPDEVTVLFDELLIGVTYFFRDSEAFAALEKKAIPQLFRAKDSASDGHSQQINDTNDGKPVRIWVPGCSTGEEAFTIGILIHEYLTKQPYSTKVQIFATDIDQRAIAKARAGRFSHSIASNLTPGRLTRYFNLQDNQYVVRREIREMMIFAEQNVLSDPPFSHLDLISCRNLMIYWNSALQKLVLPMFHYVLNPGGMLFLGTSETVAEFTNLFHTIDRQARLYEAVNPSHNTIATSAAKLPVIRNPMQNSSKKRVSEKTDSPKPAFRQVAESLLFSTYLPSAVIINSDGEVLHFYGRTGKFLEPASGDSSYSIFTMARPGLKLEMATAIRKVINQGEAATFEDVQVQTNGDFQSIDLKVQPIDESISEQPGLLLVIFEEREQDEPAAPHADDSAPDKTNRQVEALERELSKAKEFLKHTVEELETMNEELKLTNEELQTANEELQSVNEELETSKEELESLNEELVTVNTEYQHKIDALSDSNNDLNNLLSSTYIATIFLDADLSIMRFTDAASNIIHLIDIDVGRPLSHFASKMQNTSLVDEAQAVLNTLIPHESEVQTDSGDWYLMRITPYRTTDNVIQGVVMTFVDLTEQKIRQAAQQEAENRFNILASISEDIIFIFDQEEDKIQFMNHPQFMGYSVKDFVDIDAAFVKHVHPDDIDVFSVYIDNLRSKVPLEKRVAKNSFRIRRIDGDWEWVQYRRIILSQTAEASSAQILVTLRLNLPPG